MPPATLPLHRRRSPASLPRHPPLVVSLPHRRYSLRQHQFMPATRRKPAILPQPPLPPKRKERTMKMWRSQMRKPLNTSPKSKEFWSCSRRIGIWCLVSLNLICWHFLDATMVGEIKKDMN
ncbi:uncharacterized protein LOC116000492 isoform X2 [Ipomoea triloba]|uniref:uncharacterized protein LOC116000492 isoform X2 n=1 Tax=Ipomoea triloba TaxID=35885 RepID=UPI00125D8AD2|nr:uncharacterized protein LOC116000492 isoform X2 [Ipomoea triloba]